jgi:diguanylate cyclase (GGDEF)-like protein
VLRTYDRVGRYGGEEFLVVLPDCSEDLLGCIAERIRARINAKPVVTPCAEIKVTVSVGGVVTGAGRNTPAVLIRIADNALYRAKDHGRDCSVIEGEHVAAPAD